MINRHPGLFHTPLSKAIGMMPELWKAWEALPCDRRRSYTVDVKIHMLMPKQYPCIPGWHCDFVPRGKDLELLPEQTDPALKMFMWIDGHPLPEFRDGREVLANTWIEFTQLDEHQGTASIIHTWRTFIRVAPTKLCPIASRDLWLRRHTQVYLNAEDFKW